MCNKEYISRSLQGIYLRSLQGDLIRASVRTMWIRFYAPCHDGYPPEERGVLLNNALYNVQRQ